MSQSPQAGQFNSYSDTIDDDFWESYLESQSPQAGQFNSYQILKGEQHERTKCLNPLKRVNSILTILNGFEPIYQGNVSNPSSESIQFLLEKCNSQ